MYDKRFDDYEGGKFNRIISRIRDLFGVVLVSCIIFTQLCLLTLFTDINSAVIWSCMAHNDCFFYIHYI